VVGWGGGGHALLPHPAYLSPDSLRRIRDPLSLSSLGDSCLDERVRIEERRGGR
jgi:hypothetical protein